MVAKRQNDRKPKQPPFDVDAFMRERNEELRAAYTPEELEALHERLDRTVSVEGLKQADAIAREFFEGQKNGGALPRSVRTRRRA